MRMSYLRDLGKRVLKNEGVDALGKVLLMVPIR